MNDRTREQVEEWDTRTITDGYRELHELADRGFSGVVTARGTWLFMLNGRAVGVYGGPLDTFDEFEATAYLAPDPSLPLLFAMKQEGGEVEAKYYTNDTPLSEADRTLVEGNFTGYIELSENVLSGDYYVVYYGGRSMSCAFVGESERLLTDEEAFERANDEVGIYEVLKVDIGVTDIPAPEGSADDGTAAEPGAGVEGGQQPPAAESGAAGAPMDTTGGESAGPGSADASGPAAPQQSGGGDATVADLDEAAAIGTDDGADEAEWQDARTIPSLSPDSGGGEGAAAVDGGGSQPEVATGAEAGVGDARPSREGQANGGDPADGDAARPQSAGEGTGEVRRQLTTIQNERDELREEVDRLRSELQQAQSGGEGSAGDAGARRQLAADEALAGTNFFVRYGTKSGGTLEKAHAGDVDREEVNTNLRLEHHTRFEESEVTVGGEPFETFLDETMQAGFVAWVVEDLLYEIRDTNYERRLQDLYDAIPQIDRAELGGAVSVEHREDGEQYSDEVTFDVVMRDRMGNPLLVANLNDSRDPATVSMMETLVEDATTVKESNETLAGAMFVTASFFQPAALETADEAASSGLLSRDKRANYVTAASTGGYHLCLVENRGGDFHVTVPDM